MKEEVVLEWAFTPVNYFEETKNFDEGEYTLTIETGKVEAKIDAGFFHSKAGFRTELHNLLRIKFLAAQISNSKTFELSEPSMYCIGEDGKKNYYLFVDSAKISVCGGPADFKITDPSGNVTYDSKQERIEKRDQFVKLIEKHWKRNPVLRIILASYDTSRRKLDEELVYLYEICDALAMGFGSVKKAKRNLNCKSSWNTLGRLANDEPLKQGRHRGKHESLRNTTKEELEVARTIAKELIEKYVNYLESTFLKKSDDGKD